MAANVFWTCMPRYPNPEDKVNCMGTNAKTLRNANAMPAPTWHYLRMNDTEISIPGDLSVAPAVSSMVAEDVIAPAGMFEFSLAMLQRWWETAHPQDSRRQAGLAAARAADAGATYGGTAQSRYQLRADAVEAANSLEEPFETGVGAEVAELLRQAAGEPLVVASGEGQTANALVTVQGADGAFSAAAIDVVAAMDSTVNLDVVVDSPDARASSQGFTGTTIRVIAGFGARVNIRRMQTLDAGFCDIDDMGFVTADGARVQVAQTVLGGQRTSTGLACDLRGSESRIDIDLHYLGHDTQDHDFNYVVRHHGARTECDIQASGVLSGTSQKILRGTIDLIRGCKGARGNERESVLLVDEGVRNRTVPVILCNEDDVAGNHGATIGHVNAEQLRYLQARGLSEAQAEALFLESSFDHALQHAPSEQAAAGVDRLACAVLGQSVLLRDLEQDEGAE